MNFGDKLSKLRKNKNYTQEELAELLGVSRQSISKWESNIAYPETDKLIKLGKIFNCSMDYLLNDNIEEENNNNKSLFNFQFKEKISDKKIFGMPLYHIGRNAHGFFAIGLKAKGVFSLGLISRGICSLGLLSLGIISIGLLSISLLAIGCLSIGILSIGAIALGVFSIGAISIGLISIGALSIGLFSKGALAIGKYIAIGDNAIAMIAIGKTRASGSIYAVSGNNIEIGLEQIKILLDQYVPSWLSWFKDIYVRFIL